MAKSKRYRLKRKRRREGKTDYRKRLELLKSGKKRLVVRIHNNSIITQIVKYKPEGDETLVQVNSKELREHGYEGHLSNIPSSYLTGLLIGKKALEEGIEEAVLDIGNKTPTKESRVFAALKGALEAGLDISHNEKVLPSDERALGKHIEEQKDKELKIKEIASKIKESE